MNLPPRDKPNPTDPEGKKVAFTDDYIDDNREYHQARHADFLNSLRDELESLFEKSGVVPKKEGNLTEALKAFIFQAIDEYDNNASLHK